MIGSLIAVDLRVREGDLKKKERENISWRERENSEKREREKTLN